MGSILEESILHHVVIVLLVLWLLNCFEYCTSVAYFVSFIYLFLVHDRYVMKLRRKLQYEEKRSSNQRKVLSDSETVRWLNHAVEKMWGTCMEEIVSQKILLPIVPWFLEKYKPWTVKEAVVQQLYLGRCPPVFTYMRVLHQSNDDDHLVLELGMDFLTADDMGALLAVKLRKSIGFGMSAKLHLLGMHVEGKVLVGVKFVRKWPFLGRVRLCFVEPPYFQMTVKPIFTHGLDVTELPGIAGWLDKLLSVAFEQTLVEPNMLVVDVEKFASPTQESWFSIDEKGPVAHAIVEVLEAADLKPADLNGLSDPYVKGQVGPYKFRTKTQKKTLAPKWHEEFKVPITSWDAPNILCIDVLDKDHFVDDKLGDYSININELRDGQRHDMWLSLQNIKVGRLHLAITVTYGNTKESRQPCDEDNLNDYKRESFASGSSNKNSFSSVASDKSPRLADKFEPIDVKGQRETGIWIHQPGSEVVPVWEPRKGKDRQLDTQIQGEVSPAGSFKMRASGSFKDNESKADENIDAEKAHKSNSVHRGIHKVGSLFHRRKSGKEKSSSPEETVESPHVDLRSMSTNEIGVKFIVDDTVLSPDAATPTKSPTVDGKQSSEGSGSDSPKKGNGKNKAKSVFKQSCSGIKHVLSRKGSKLSGPEESNASDEGTAPASVSASGVETVQLPPN